MVFSTARLSGPYEGDAVHAVRGRGPPKLDMHPSQRIGLDRWGSKKDEVHTGRLHRESAPSSSPFELLLSVKSASVLGCSLRNVHYHLHVCDGFLFVIESE